ncbi:MAG: hypothetical protein JXR36_08395 [Bacteroidales bacterium]|jgi:hypothetical protein|nr:hypothetical protein [Bacteroidales bacterium]
MKLKILSVLTLIFVFTACTYYEHGPVVSLKTATARLSGQWELCDVIVNDKTDDVLLESEKNIIYTFTEDGNLLIENTIDTRSISETIVANWEFNQDKTSIIIDFDTENEISVINCKEITILRLTDEELWISDINSPGRVNNFVTERRYRKISKI